MEDYLKQFSFEKVPDGEKHFSQEEMDGLKRRLKKVEDQLADELKKAISDKTKLKKELKDLQKEFTTLKQTMPHLTKKGWFRSMVSKLYIWGAKKENQQIIKATATYDKAFL